MHVRTLPLPASPTATIFFVIELLSYSSVRLFEKKFVLDLKPEGMETTLVEPKMRGYGLGIRVGANNIPVHSRRLLFI